MKLKEGIVVRSNVYQDNSKIINVVTETGKDSIILKGATNLKGHTFSYSHELTKIGYETSRNYLKAGKVINTFPKIRSDYNKLESGLKIIEIANILNEHINDFKTFYYFLDQILNLLNDTKFYELIELTFRVKTLFLLGIAPVFSRCVSCGNKENLIDFSFNGGGMKCKNCISGSDLIVNKSAVSLLKILYLTKLDDLEDIYNLIKDYDYKEADLFLNSYYEQYLGFKSNVTKVFSNF